jgi:anti-anti-sigma factor
VFALARDEPADGVIILSLVGELDLATVSRLEAQLRNDERPGRVIVADLRELRFIDSSGLQALVRADQRLRQDGGRLAIVAGSLQVQRVFELTGIDRLLEIVEDPATVLVAGSASERSSVGASAAPINPGHA